MAKIKGIDPGVLRITGAMLYLILFLSLKLNFLEKKIYKKAHTKFILMFFIF
jgi:hypothetical protein